MILVLSKCGGPIFRLPEFIQEINSFNSGMLVLVVSPFDVLYLYDWRRTFKGHYNLVTSLIVKIIPIQHFQSEGLRKSHKNSNLTTQKLYGKPPFGGPPLKDKRNRLRVLHCDGWIVPPVTYRGVRGHSKLIQESSTAGDRSAVE